MRFKRTRRTTHRGPRIYATEGEAAEGSLTLPSSKGTLVISGTILTVDGYRDTRFTVNCLRGMVKDADKRGGVKVTLGDTLEIIGKAALECSLSGAELLATIELFGGAEVLGGISSFGIGASILISTTDEEHGLTVVNKGSVFDIYVTAEACRAGKLKRGGRDEQGT